VAANSFEMLQNEVRLNNRMLESLNNVVKTITLRLDFDTKTIPISRVDSRVFNQALANLKITFDVDDADWDNLPSEAEETGDQALRFKWLIDREDNRDNCAAYMGYLGAFPWPNGFIILDVSRQKDLLKTGFTGFSFGGTIDVVLTTADGSAAGAFIGNIFLGIELKKPSGTGSVKTYHKQVIVQHLSASFRCPDIRVLTLLTDLNDLWCFFWLGPDGCICKRKTDVAGSKFLVKNMFNLEAASNCPEGFQSRLSWNDFIRDHHSSARRGIPGRSDGDGDDGNSNTNADSKKSSTDDDGDMNRGDVQGGSKDSIPGSTKAVDTGKTAKGAVHKSEWNDGPLSAYYHEDLLDLLDEQEFSELVFKASIEAIYPGCFTSTANEGKGNSSSLRLTEMNLIRHNAMLGGSLKRHSREVSPVKSPLHLADTEFASSSPQKKQPRSTHTTLASTPNTKLEVPGPDSRSVADMESEWIAGTEAGNSKALKLLIPPPVAAVPTLRHPEPCVLSESFESNCPVHVTKDKFTGVSKLRASSEAAQSDSVLLPSYFSASQVRRVRKAAADRESSSVSGDSGGEDALVSEQASQDAWGKPGGWTTTRTGHRPSLSPSREVS
jgi:hypothetical protein